jgi:hypothetical protein
MKQYKSFILSGMVILVSPVLAQAATPVFSTEQPFSMGSDWEPSLIADPNSSYIYMVAVRDHDNINKSKIMMRVSSDNGATYGSEFQVCAANCNGYQTDPHLLVGPDGTLFLTYLHGGNKIAFMRSTNHGQTWTETPVPVTNGIGWQDYPWPVISPNMQEVYISSIGSNSAYMNVSHDYGVTFGDPIAISRTDDPQDKRWVYGNGGAAKANAVYYAETTSTRQYDGTIAINCRYSNDLGATWERVNIENSVQGSIQAMNSLAIDKNGQTLYFAYSSSSVVGEPKKLYFKKGTNCTDLGAATVLNVEGDSNFPVVVAGNVPGDVRVTWQDDRNGANRYNTYYIESKDYGVTWTAPVKLSNETNLYAWAPYKFLNGYFLPYGDYTALTVDQNGKAHAIWGEGFSRSMPGGSWFVGQQ